MGPSGRVVVLECLETKLSSREDQGPCMLVGVRSRDSVTVIDLMNTPEDASGDGAQLLQQLLPYGLDYVGSWAATRDAAAQLLERHATAARDPSSPAVVMHGGGGGSSALSACMVLSASKASACSPQGTAPMGDGGLPTSSALAWMAAPGLRLLRLRAMLDLQVHTSTVASGGGQPSGAAASVADLSATFESLRRQLCDPQLAFVLSPPGGGSGASTLLPPASAASALSPGEVTLASVAGSPGDRPIDATPMLMRGGAKPNGAGGAAAPTFEFQSAGHAAVAQARTALQLDVLAFVPGTAPLATLAEVHLVPALQAQLRSAEAAMAAPSGVGATDGQPRLLSLSARHFLPPGRSHHVTALFPRLKSDADADEAALAQYRRRLHTLLGLPMDRPALRAACALAWGGGDGAALEHPRDPQVRLVDVHEGLAAPGAAGDVHVVQGSYDYHHYMQDRFDDNGWGCAYRSLQTLCSWFRRQQYTSKPSPGHRAIQQALVRMGDKDKSFVGSNKWIGAIELSYILDDYLGVVSKILTVNRGADIPQHARELARHFDTQGTPVMIGGGVLAYTLLGVYFNESTGDCAFLILDPHYTGGESLDKIHKGTWVGWKRPGDSAAAGGPLFVNDAFYNFLCPQRPREV